MKISLAGISAVEGDDFRHGRVVDPRKPEDWISHVERWIKLCTVRRPRPPRLGRWNVPGLRLKHDAVVSRCDVGKFVHPAVVALYTRLRHCSEMPQVGSSRNRQQEKMCVADGLPGLVDNAS